MKTNKSLRITVLFLFLSFFIAVFFYLKSQIHASSIANFYKKSAQKLEQVDDYINIFFEMYKENIIELASMPELLIAHKDFPSYREKEGELTWSYEALSLAGKKVIEKWRSFVTEDTDIADIYAGFESGTSISYEAYEFPVGFLGAERSWYKEAKACVDNVHIGNAYLSLSGENVTPVTHKIYDHNARFIGVIGLDISLVSISKHIQRLNFDDTGFFLLVEKSGRVLCHSKKPDYNFRFIHELPDLAWEDIFSTEKQDYMVTFSNKKTYLVSSLYGSSGYRMLAIQSLDEVIANSYTSNAYILSIFLFLISAIVLFYVIFRSVKKAK